MSPSHGVAVRGSTCCVKYLICLKALTNPSPNMIYRETVTSSRCGSTLINVYTRAANAPIKFLIASVFAVQPRLHGWLGKASYPLKGLKVAGALRAAAPAC
eukprot:4168508-Amphidinium_carterae.1